MIKDPRLVETVATLLIKHNLADEKHVNKSHHITFVYGNTPIFLCGICEEMKQNGVLARARNGSGKRTKISRWSYFICSDCIEKGSAGRTP
jgi:hypothetical protein